MKADTIAERFVSSLIEQLRSPSRIVFNMRPRVTPCPVCRRQQTISLARMSTQQRLNNQAAIYRASDGLTNSLIFQQRVADIKRKVLNNCSASLFNA